MPLLFFLSVAAAAPPSVINCRAVASDEVGSNYSGALTFPTLSRTKPAGVLFGSTSKAGVSSLVRATPGGAQTIIASTNEPIPALQNRSFSTLNGAADSVAGVAFQAGGPRVNGSLYSSFSGVFTGVQPHHTVVAETGSLMPSAPSGYRFALFGAPALADDGAVFFAGTNASGSGSWKGVYERPGGASVQLAKIIDTGDTHPITGGRFTNIVGPSIDRRAQTVAFFASSPSRSDPTVHVDGLYAGMLLPNLRPEVHRRLVIVAEQGDTVPGLAQRFTDFTNPVTDADNSSVVAFVGSDTAGAEGLYVSILNVDEVRAVRVRKVAYAGSGVATKVVDMSGAEHTIHFLTFNQPPSVVASARQVMFLAAAEPPEASGIYLATEWGDKIYQVASLAPPLPGMKTCDGMDAGFASLGFQAGSFDGTRFVFFGTSKQNSTIFASELAFRTNRS